MAASRAVATKAVAASSSVSSSSTKRERETLLPLMSELIQITALLSSLERLAGRGAMIGFLVAAATEAIIPSTGLFGGWEHPQDLGWGATLLISLSALLAYTSKRRVGQGLLEPVIASLTSQSSRKGVSSQNVDRAMDFLMDSVFCSTFLRDAFPIDSDNDRYI